MRAITSVTSTLDAPPEAFFVFAKMVFTDATPEGYQPPGFVDAGDAAVGWFATRCAAARAVHSSAAAAVAPAVNLRSAPACARF